MEQVNIYNMRKILPILSLLFICSCSVQETDPYDACLPSSVTPDFTNSIDGLFEGDIIPDKGYLQKGVIISEYDRLWPLAIVPYYYQKRENGFLGFNKEQQLNIDMALRDLSESGVIWVKYENGYDLKKDFPDGVRIEPHFKNASHVGRQGGIQRILLGFAFTEEEFREQYANALHEGGHVQGFWHEHNKSFRDKYIDIHEENIYPAYLIQFEKYAEGVSIECGDPVIDFENPMIFGSTDGSKTGEEIAMSKKDGSTWERAYSLSEGFIKTSQAMYRIEIEKREDQ